jgi:cytochrome c
MMARSLQWIAAAALMAPGTTGIAMAGPVPHHSAVAASARKIPVITGDPVAGRGLYQACSGCHSIDENDVGPRHRGVVGRRAGSVPGYAYSAALRTSGIVWTPANLDRWLTNPQKVVPGTRMYFSVANPKQRADIIAYLAQQH